MRSDKSPFFKGGNCKCHEQSMKLKFSTDSPPPFEKGGLGGIFSALKKYKQTLYK